jgi:uncharacterized protein YidB (DUF937 family)
MGLFDGLAGNLGSLLSQQGGDDHSANIVGALIGGGQQGDIGNVLETLASNGLADQVASWTNNGANLPISPDQLRDALGSDQVQQMAQASGLPVGDFLQHLSSHLPAAASATADQSDQDG